MERLDNVPEYKIAEMNYLLENKAPSRLGVRSSDPGALNGGGCGQAFQLLLKSYGTCDEANAYRNTIQQG